MWCGSEPNKNVSPATLSLSDCFGSTLMLLLIAGLTLAASGSITRPILELLMIGLPGLLLGAWAGFRLYGRLDDETFRKVVLALLLASGLFLLAAFR